jgi:hypothetical protein
LMLDYIHIIGKSQAHTLKYFWIFPKCLSHIDLR